MTFKTEGAWYSDRNLVFSPLFKAHYKLWKVQKTVLYMKQWFFSCRKLLQLWVLSKHGSKGNGLWQQADVVFLSNSSWQSNQIWMVSNYLWHIVYPNTNSLDTEKEVWSNVHILLQVMKRMCYSKLASRGKSILQSKQR